VPVVDALVVNSEEFADNHDKARIFMESFFPKMADPSEETLLQQRGNLRGADY
jgi:hypothetical protein